MAKRFTIPRVEPFFREKETGRRVDYAFKVLEEQVRDKLQVVVATLSEITANAGEITGGRVYHAATSTGISFDGLNLTGFSRYINFAANSAANYFIYTPNFWVKGDGSAQFAGALSAASGTFAGSLSAASGTFAGSLTAAGKVEVTNDLWVKHGASSESSFTKISSQRIDWGNSGLLGPWSYIKANETGPKVSAYATRLFTSSSIGTADIWLDANGEILLDGASGTRVIGDLGFYDTAPISKPTVSGSKGGNAALSSLMTALSNLGLVTDSTT